LLCELCNRGRDCALVRGGVLEPLRFKPGRLVFDFDFAEDSVVGGDDLSNHEFSVDDDLFCGRSLVLPSLLEFSEDVPVPMSSVLTDSLDRRRRLSRKDGIFSRRKTGVRRS
jgi:hypothetical protein